MTKLKHFVTLARGGVDIEISIEIAVRVVLESVTKLRHFVTRRKPAIPSYIAISYTKCDSLLRLKLKK